MKKLLVLILLISVTSCYDSDDSVLYEKDTKWWILARPNNYNVGKPGIFLYNETKSVIEKTLELPEGIQSPHALEFDGEHLWLGGMGENESIYKLNSKNGSVVSEIQDARTEGISILNGELYYSFYSVIYKVNQNGEQIEKIKIPNGHFLSDIAINNSDIYYVYNESIDPIVKINTNDSEDEIIAETNVSSLCTLAIHKQSLVVITNSNQIRRFDINSGKKISDTETNIKGWITAIAPYNNN